jgi:hypothetical protein
MRLVCASSDAASPCEQSPSPEVTAALQSNSTAKHKSSTAQQLFVSQINELPKLR